jgi:hypothetical protein
MAPPAIIAKLQTLLAKGVATEAEALYLIVEVRKLLEQQQAKKQYEYLTFHCDWAVHPTLNGPTAQKLLEQFDAANIHLKSGVKLSDLPDSLRMQIDRISKMELFEEEFETFLVANGITSVETSRSDGWNHFLHLYGKIVEDCPLVMTPKNHSASIENVTLKLELAASAPEGIEGEQFFRIRWIVQDKNGLTGTIDIYSSFSQDPKA